MCKSNHDRQLWKDNEALAASLGDEQKNAKKGLLMSVTLNIPGTYEINRYNFLLDKDPPSANVHPNLWEQAKLNMNIGLYRVNNIVEQEKPGVTGKYAVKKGDVFQLRGYDLANMTIVYDGKGWVVMDVLTTTETARAVWKDIVMEYLPDAPIRMVIYSHSHIDHYGGIGGLKLYFYKDPNLNNEHDCKIIAPADFTKHAVSENIYAGTAMSRRAVYQYGNNLDVGPDGQVDCGLGKMVAKGTNGIIKPTKEIGINDYAEKKKYAIEYSNGLELRIQLTPGTEAPAEMNIYLHEQKVLFIAENCAGTLHNLLTPRGAQVRDPLAWADFLDETITTFADVETVCSAHNWPHFGNVESIRFMEIQRDMYRYLNNATLHLINLGYTIDEVGRMISGEDGTLPLPRAFEDEWCCHGFYGAYNHDAKAVYQRYIGWYDGNPAHLNRHKPTDRATRYIISFGAKAILEKALKANADKDFAWAAELFDLLANANITDDPNMKNADIDKFKEDMKTGYYEALTQLGYQSEASSWRNMYLTGAQEIYPGKKSNASENEKPYLYFSEDTVRAMSLKMILQFMGITLSSKTVEAKRYVLRLEVDVTEGDNHEYAAAYIYRGILGYRITANKPEDGDFPISISKEATLCISGTKLDFFRAFIEQDSAALKKLVIKGDADTLITHLVRFPLGFPIMTPRPTL